tara:strand:- start:796 stop:1530 length:735 start_codon:yes stop_codon:yes gene_type:complete
MPPSLKKPFLKSIIVFILLSFPPIVGSEETYFKLPGQPLGREEAIFAIERIRELQKDIKVITAKVFQRKRTRFTKNDIVSEGTITLKKPNLLYWKVESPERIIVVVDGKRFWLYHPELKEVQRHFLAQNMAARFSMDFFSSSIKVSLKELEKKFKVAIYSPPGIYLLELKPRSKFTAKYLSKISIWYRKEDGVPVRFEVTGQKNNYTVTTFKKISINPKIEKGLFDFIVPEGVEIINEDEDEFE